MSCCDNNNNQKAHDHSGCQHDGMENHKCSNNHEHCENHNNDEKDYYTCPMHPEVKQDLPGKCQKCNGMDLVLKSKLDKGGKL